MEDDRLLLSLCAWLRWHAATRAEIDKAPEECRPILEAMGKASGVGAVARLAERIQGLCAEPTLDVRPELQLGSGPCPRCSARAWRPYRPRPEARKRLVCLGCDHTEDGEHFPARVNVTPRWPRVQPASSCDWAAARAAQTEGARVLLRENGDNTGTFRAVVMLVDGTVIEEGT